MGRRENQGPKGTEDGTERREREVLQVLLVRLAHEETSASQASLGLKVPGGPEAHQVSLELWG